MKYTNFKDNKVSLLGMGCMRLPLDADGKVDEAEAIRIIRHGIDEGITYVDTAYMYHDGLSEKVLGKALKDGYREKVLLADKMPPWMAKSEEDIEKIFNKQLERLQTDCIDMYLVHNVGGKLWKFTERYNVLDFLAKKKEEGKIRHIGFSFHDDYEFFEEVIDKFPWEFVQIQLNYIDENFQAGVKGLKLAGEKGLPVIIMEPLKGGRLASTMPPAVDEIWSQMKEKRTPVEWAFRWVADFPEVMTILSGMSSYEQLEDNIRIFADLEAGNLTADEKKVISSVADKFREIIEYDCTKCRYCMPCPEKIDIPRTIDLYNQLGIYDNADAIRIEYSWMAPHLPSKCVTCKKCESHCPQSLPISDIMKKAAAEFENK